jgi:hypothetical protein
VKVVLFFLVVFVSANVSAAEVTTKIYDIIEADKSESKLLILAQSGDVFELDQHKSTTVDAAWFAFNNNLYIKVKSADLSINKILGLRENISKIELISESNFEKEFISDRYESVPTPLNNFSLTEIKDLENAKSLFDTMRTDTRRSSQCYNRAHVWSYNLSKKGINLGKIWIFFNKRYIKKYRFKWWFHIAPYLEVKNQEELIVIDREFTKKPVGLTEWKNIFMKNNAPCPTVEYYSDYRDNFWDGSEFCYFIKSSMYYWMPKDIEALESGAVEKRSWNKDELETAYKNAIRRWRGDI